MLTRTIPAGDLALVNGTFAFIAGPAFVRQKIASRFQFWVGEWFLDLRQGIPYRRDVFVKNPDVDIVRSLFKRVVLTTPGVAYVPSFEFLYDSRARSGAFDFVAKLKNGAGAVIVTPADRDFLVDVDLTT